MLHLGVDIGGTKIEIAVVDLQKNFTYKIIKTQRIPTNAKDGYDSVVTRLAEFINIYLKEFPKIKDVGIGMPGSFTPSGTVKNSNTVCFNGRFFKTDLQSKIMVSARFANDANCFALAEATLGAGRNHNVVFGVIMGTGVGGGLVIKGEVIEGLQSICGEWGHTTLWPSSQRQCYCGKNGCVELFLSGTGIQNHYKQLSGDSLEVSEILEAAKEGYVFAIECKEYWLDNFGRALSNLINILDPDAIVLGGGVSNCQCLYSEGIQRVARYTFTDELITPILKHKISDSAGVLGAALLTAKL